MADGRGRSFSPNRSNNSVATLSAPAIIGNSMVCSKEIFFFLVKAEDERVHDIFEKADKMMYERKKELKATVAKTRR